MCITSTKLISHYLVRWVEEDTVNVIHCSNIVAVKRVVDWCNTKGLRFEVVLSEQLKDRLLRD